jgi:hypothetical protein
VVFALGVWLAAASFSRRRPLSGMVGFVIGASGAAAGAAVLCSGLARSMFG